MGGTHARNAPSDASRWMHCAASLEFTKDYPNESSSFADEGTAAHTIREMCLEFGFDAYDFIGTQIMVNGVIYECDDEMADHLQPGIDELREFAGEMFVEKHVDTTEWVGLDTNGNRQGGTLDGGVAGEHLIVISDLKYGMGIPVSPVKNEQQMLYALAAWKQLFRHITKATKFLIIIDQPRNSAGGGYWTVTLDELLQFGERVRVAAEKTRDPNAEFTPGKKQCSWCPAANVLGRAGGCAAHANWVLGEVGIKVDDLDAVEAWEAPKLASFTPARLVRLAMAKKPIEQLLEWAHAQAIDVLIDEGPIAGMKAVPGRQPPRKWTDADAGEAYMRQTLKTKNPFNQKLKSPAQVEKEIGKKYKVPKALIEQGRPKPVMVSVDDDRPAIQSLNSHVDDLDAMFDNLDA